METKGSIRVDWQDLKKFCTNTLAGAGLPPAEADIVADSLIHADLAGLPSHGVARLNDYLIRLDKVS